MVNSLPGSGWGRHHRAEDGPGDPPLWPARPGIGLIGTLVAAALALVVAACGPTPEAMQSSARPGSTVSASEATEAAPRLDASIVSSPESDSEPSPSPSLDLEPMGQSTTTRPGPTGSTDSTGSAAPAPKAAEATVPAEPLPDGVVPRPDWLGRRPLPTTPDGLVQTPQSTPAELRDRRLTTVDGLAPPADATYAATVSPIPTEVLNRSTWNPDCPVGVDDLAYLTLTFWGFDQRPHTGEMIVHQRVADDIVEVFRQLFEARFPIEQMTITAPSDLEAAPTGDGNGTGSFVCRAITGGTAFSEHAYGLAIDINPFHNPYQRGDLILPELSSHYLDRTLDQPGMIVDGDVVVEAFADIGWSWGGNWRSLKDYQHFSHNGR